MIDLPDHHDERVPATLRPVGVVLLCAGALLRWWVVLDVPVDLGRIGVGLLVLGATVLLAPVALGPVRFCRWFVAHSATNHRQNATTAAASAQDQRRAFGNPR